MLIALALVRLTAAAAAGLPERPDLGHIEDIGRLKTFVSPTQVIWVYPAAFASALTCLDASAGEPRLCTLKITNALREDEKSRFAALSNSGSTVTHFTNIDPFVQRIDESFVGLPAFITAKPMLLRSLQLGRSNLTYASISQRVPSQQAEQLLAAFESDGVGTFQSKVVLQAQRTLASAVLTDPADLRARLVTLPAAFDFDAVKAAVNASLKTSAITVQGTDPDEAAILLMFFVRQHCIKPMVNGQYERTIGAEQCLPKPLVLFRDTVAPVSVECVAYLPLKKNASVSSSCSSK